ncbi:terminase [Spirosoma arboris]|uniref:terminase n=1 Tax=Spirosoma arboris TaxID=2682092 RepID=UPI0018DD663D|nr:terminase [Spirosoma arboris]
MPAPEGNDNAIGNDGGRPTKYEKGYAKQAFHYCLLGATDKDLATFFEVSESTIDNWKRENVEFLGSVKRGKIIADANVAKALYKRATGYKYREVTFEKIADKLTLESMADQVITQDAYKKKIVTKHLPPDPGAAMNWLKNRAPTLWREGFDINLNKGEDIEIWSAEDVIAFQKWKQSQQPDGN